MISRASLWKIIIIVSAVAAVLCLCAGMANSVANSEKAIELENERISKELEATKAKSKAVEDELTALRNELEVIKNEIAESVRVREEMHDAIDNAVTIDDVNDLLRQRRGRGK